MFRDQVVFITGGTGSWGQCLTKYLLKEQVKEVRIFSRNEAAQVAMERTFKNDHIKFIIGDVRDEHRLTETMKDVDYVFHLAALKHVPICEEHPLEAIMTNIMGTKNVIEAAIRNKVKKVIDVSSDKAVTPHNMYGMTKAIGEKLIIAANKKTDDTKFVCIRAGNVMGSTGSVIPLFINQLKTDNSITITDARMTRFFITLDEAIELLIKSVSISFGGEILVMNMPSLKIEDLANVLGKYYSSDAFKINYVGIRPGEKIHEELISNIEMLNTYQLDENYYLIIPTIVKERLEKYHHNFTDYKKVTFSSYNSSSHLLSNEQIEEKLKSGHFIEEVKE